MLGICNLIGKKHYIFKANDESNSISVIGKSEFI